MKISHIAALAMILASGPAYTEKLSKDDLRAISMSVDQMARLVSVNRGDELDPTIEVSTRDVLRKNGTDRWFRAFKNKKSGIVEYQFYIVLAMPDSYRPKRLNFIGPDGLVEREVQKIGYDVDCHRYGCTHYEDAIVILSREEMEFLSKDAKPGEDSVWAAKLFGKFTDGIPINTLKTETAAILSVIDGLDQP